MKHAERSERANLSFGPFSCQLPVTADEWLTVVPLRRAQDLLIILISGRTDRSRRILIEQVWPERGRPGKPEVNIGASQASSAIPAGDIANVRAAATGSPCRSVRPLRPWVRRRWSSCHRVWPVWLAKRTIPRPGEAARTNSLRLSEPAASARRRLQLRPRMPPSSTVKFLRGSGSPVLRRLLLLYWQLIRLGDQTDDVVQPGRADANPTLLVLDGCSTSSWRFSTSAVSAVPTLHLLATAEGDASKANMSMNSPR